MSIVAIIFVLSSVFATGDLSEPTGFSDYYWREYAGVIPPDALPGGMDAFGSRTYIGQIKCELCIANSPGTFTLLPATIYRGSQVAVGTAYYKMVTSDKLVKILCAQNPDKYKWMPTNNSDSHLLTECHAVIGGTEVGYVLNIGRVRYGTDTIIGKVFPSHAPNHGLYIKNNDGNEARYQSYELLTYNCGVRSPQLVRISLHSK